MNIKSKIKQLEHLLNKNKLTIRLVTGDKISFSNDELLSLFNESVHFMPAVDADGKTHYPAAEELSDNMQAVMYAVEGQSDFIDMVQGIVKDYKEATE